MGVGGGGQALAAVKLQIQLVAGESTWAAVELQVRATCFEEVQRSSLGSFQE